MPHDQEKSLDDIGCQKVFVTPSSVNQVTWGDRFLFLFCFWSQEVLKGFHLYAVKVAKASIMAGLCEQRAGSS